MGNAIRIYILAHNLSKFAVNSGIYSVPPAPQTQAEHSKTTQVQARQNTRSAKRESAQKTQEQQGVNSL